MSAAQASALGANVFNAWIDGQVGRRQRHRSVTERFWWVSQPAIGFVRKRPTRAAMLVSLAFGAVMLWKVSTR